MNVLSIILFHYLIKKHYYYKSYYFKQSIIIKQIGLTIPLKYLTYSNSKTGMCLK